MRPHDNAAAPWYTGCMNMLKRMLPAAAGFAVGAAFVCFAFAYKNARAVYGVYIDPLLTERCGTVSLPERFVRVDSPDGSGAKGLKGANGTNGTFPVALRIDVRTETGGLGVSASRTDPVPEDGLRFRYTLSEEPLFPIVERGADGRESVSLYAESAVPDGAAALPMDWKYAGDESYPAVSVTYAEGTYCLPLPEKLKIPLTHWLDAVFAAADAQPARPETAFIAAVGDIMAGRGVEALLLKDGGVEKVFTDTLPVLRANDILIGNLEGAVTGGTAKAVKTYTFKFNKKILPALREAGFTYLMVTNNHSFDYGLQGFTDTLAALAEYGIPTSGAGSSADEARRFYHTTVRGLPVAILSCGAYPVERSGFSGQRDAAARADRAGILWQSDDVFDLVRAEKEKGFFVIVNVHGGEEYVFTPSAAQKTFYTGLCDAGADVVFGSHPHVLQPVERYGSSLIAYSLGNFVFPGMEGMRGATDSLVVRLGVYNGRIRYTETYLAALSGTSVSLKKDR
ncbi:Capsule synthesis protein, CapA [Treponema brennaborense DSM 12168]|uniref:Capsule synthesis protein, CapA n=2 Tax=Treponema TaxID=157 RepID=F4LQ16_TREBD|nr:Capsule synthesis protein, CapA [Treponema brennaborense DSM 12168]